MGQPTRDYPVFPSQALEARVQAIGRELLARVGREKRTFFSADWWTSELFEWALAHEEAKLRLFRFVDVLPALNRHQDVARHFREYFKGRDVPFSVLVKTALGVSRAGWLGEKVIAAMLRETVRRLSRRFIAGSTPEQAVRAALEARRSGQAFTFDVLGEACVSEAEADAYESAYLDLVERLGKEAFQWAGDPRLDRAAWGELPRVNVSVKLSALYPYLDPLDPRRSSEAVKARLRSILRAAQRWGAHIQIDMEEQRLKDLTLRIFMELADEGEFRRNRNVGVVVQAYLRSSEADARRIVAWARGRGTPITIRLVKGAYWDYETARARLEQRAVPVFELKHETDASFERLTHLFLESSDAVDLAVGSHDVRSIAHAIAMRGELGLLQNQMEFQLLYGMAAPLARALTEREERVRVYMPFGDLIPGMGYLVRRLLENSSNESFLGRGFARGEPLEALLADPATVPSPATPHREVRGFTNEPRADFALASEREKVAAGLRTVREEFGKFYPLVIGGEEIDTSDRLVSLNPSRPDEVVGRTASASVDDVDRAVAAALRAFPQWRDVGALERSRRLGKVADLLRRRKAELAAWIVYEAGKPWPEADADVAEAIDFVEYYRQEAPALQEPRKLGDLRGEVNHYLREPRSVVGVIAPWNFPLAILTGMTGAALATGNTVVMKPAEQAPVVAAKLMAIFEQAGLPPGVVNYAPGLGEIAGARLVRHPNVAMIAFTGSLEVGTAIYATAAQHIPGTRQHKRVVAEMGGKNAVIVDDDADLDEAVQGIVASAFGYAGQKCSACSRVISVGLIYDRLVERLVEAVRTLPMGPADAPGTIVGPVIDPASRERIEGSIRLGRQVSRPGLIRELPRDLSTLGGYYVPPAIFCDVPPGSTLAREEIFGPVLSLIRAKSFDEAIEIAMSVDFALTGGIFSRSPAHLIAARRAFRVGTLYLNRAITGAMVGRQPFGGRQLSGLGSQAGGPDYLIQFVETRVVTENTLRRGFASGELT